jgi:hypothetical protein
MPDSLPLTTARRPQSRSHATDYYENYEPVNPLNRIVPGSALAAPPRDVARLLVCYGTGMQRYLDVQRLQGMAQLRERWPVLRGSPQAPVPDAEALKCA